MKPNCSPQSPGEHGEQARVSGLASKFLTTCRCATILLRILAPLTPSPGPRAQVQPAEDLTGDARGDAQGHCWETFPGAPQDLRYDFMFKSHNFPGQDGGLLELEGAPWKDMYSAQSRALRT